MTRFIDQYRGDYGVEPICQALEVSASAYYQRKTGRRSEPAIEDERLLALIRQTHEDNFYAYGYRKMWKTLLRAGESVSRCRVQRLMATNGIVRAKRRGKPWRTTIPDPSARVVSPSGLRGDAALNACIDSEQATNRNRSGRRLT